MGYISILFSLFFVCTGIAGSAGNAGVDRRGSVDPVSIQGGSSVRERMVSPSTSTSVDISSAILNTNLGTTNRWRTRIIVNMSSHAALQINASDAYDFYGTTVGIHLSSFSLTSDEDTWETNYQGKLWGVWDDSGYLGTEGAYIWEEYVK